MEQLDNMYTMADIEKETGIPPRKILYRIRKGELPGARKVGWMWVLSEEDLSIIKKLYNIKEPEEEKKRKKKKKKKKE